MARTCQYWSLFAQELGGAGGEAGQGSSPSALLRPPSPAWVHGQLLSWEPEIPLKWAGTSPKPRHKHTATNYNSRGSAGASAGPEAVVRSTGVEGEALRLPPSKSLEGLTGVPCKQGQGHSLGVHCSRRGSKEAVWSTPQGGLCCCPLESGRFLPCGWDRTEPKGLGQTPVPLSPVSPGSSLWSECPAHGRSIGGRTVGPAQPPCPAQRRVHQAPQPQGLKVL